MRAGATAGSDRPASTVPMQLKVAVAIIGVEALGLLAVAGVLLVKSIVGTPHSLTGALLEAVGAIIGAAVLLLCGRAMLQLRPAARTPVVVLQLLALPVAFSLAFQAGLVGYGGPILVAALAVLYLLFTPAVRAVLERERG